MVSTVPMRVLILDGQQIPPDIEGKYAVPYRLMRSRDLSQFPRGIVIRVGAPEADESDSELAITINEIEVLDQKRVWASASHHPCPDCWSHALRYEGFAIAAAEMMKKVASTHSNFRIDKVEYDNARGVTFRFGFEVTNGSFDEIESTVDEYLFGVLKPLLERLQELDADFPLQ